MDHAAKFANALTEFVDKQRINRRLRVKSEDKTTLLARGFLEYRAPNRRTQFIERWRAEVKQALGRINGKMIVE